MINIFHIATSTWFYTHALETLLIIAVAFTSIGFFFGFLMWRHYQFHVRRILTTNNKLRDKISVIQTHQQKLASQLSTDTNPAEDTNS